MNPIAFGFSRFCKQKMAVAVLSFQSIFHFSSSSLTLNNQPRLKKLVLSFSEIADKSTPFSSLQLPFSSEISNGNTSGSRPRKCNASGGRKKGDESKESSNGNKAPSSTSQEEIIALFRRIQSSISKDKTKTKSFSSSKDNSAADSVLDVLRDSRKNVQDTRLKKEGKALRWRSRVHKKRQQMEEKAPAATQDFKLSRPPSNFVKRSPIPYPTTPRGMNLEQSNEAMETNEGSKLANMEKMKLPELKELAKASGIKGYSRMKKSELVQLLRP